MTVAATTEGITRVRLQPLRLSPDDGAAAARALEVTWDSTQEARWHQVYVGGRLAGVTARPADRRLVVPMPADEAGAAGRALVEVLAVDAEDRWRDRADALAGPAACPGWRVELAWEAGPHLDAGLAGFDVFGDGRTGTVDLAAPLNPLPIPARPGGLAPWGHGTGGYGRGGWGEGTARFAWTSPGLAPGTWRFAVRAVDAAGNPAATVAEVACTVVGLPAPPTDVRVAAYAPEGGAHLAWDPSPDLS